MGLSSLGVGSGIDAGALVQSLMKSEQIPLNTLNSKKVDLNSKLTAFAQVKTNLAQFKSAIDTLSTPDKFKTYSISSNDTGSVSSSLSGKPVPGMYEIEVSQLAQSQKIISRGLQSVDSIVGNGTLTFSFGSISGGTLSNGIYSGSSFNNNGIAAKTITIDSSNNSLVGIRNAINTAAIGITASIVNDGTNTPFRLVLTNTETGEAQSMKISVGNETDGNSALSDLLSYDPSNVDKQSLSQSRKAQNAVFKLDGISISKPSNTVTDALEGVSLVLNKTNIGNPSAIYISKDTSNLSTNLENIVKQYNSLVSFIDTQTKYDTTTKQGAVLWGESALRSVKSQIRSLLSASLPQGTGTYTAINQLGITFQKDGTLLLDSTKLKSALEKNTDDVAKLFAASGSTSDSQVSYVGSNANTKPGTYSINISQLANQGSLLGSNFPNLTIAPGSDTLTVNLNGVSTTITLASGEYSSIQSLASEVQSKINGYSGFTDLGYSVQVIVVDGKLKLVSNRFGSSSMVTLSGTAANNILGGDGVATTGTNLTGTINGKTASSNGQTLTASSGSDAEGLTIKVVGGTVGSRGNVSYSKGIANSLNQAISAFTASSGVITSRTEGINASLKKLDTNITNMQEKLTKLQKYYEQKFSSLDNIMSQLNNTSTSLTQQLAALPNSNNNKK